VLALARLYAATETALAVFGLLSPPLLSSPRGAHGGQFLHADGGLLGLLPAAADAADGRDAADRAQAAPSLCRSLPRVASALYFVNTLGSAFGALIGAYVLISFVGLVGAIDIAATLNIVLAVAVFVALPDARLPAPVAPAPVPRADLLGSKAQYLVFVTGFVAIGYEIAWTVNISAILKSSPYMFATILFVYLLAWRSAAWR